MISDCFPMEYAGPCHGGGMTMKQAAENCPHMKGSRLELQGAWASWLMLGKEDKYGSTHNDANILCASFEDLYSDKRHLLSTFQAGTRPGAIQNKIYTLDVS